MRKLLKSLACFATAALVGASAFANYDWYDTSIGIGGIKSNFQDWSRGNGAPDTDLGALTSLTLSSVEMNIWDDDNDRGGVNMFFRLYGADGQIGGDVDVWLGGAERIEGSVHDFSVSYTGPFDLADAFGVTLEDGKTYYLNMWAKSYGDSGDHWYNGDGDNYHTKFVYCGTPKTYTLVESADDLVVGADYLVVSTVDGAYSAMKNAVNGSGIGCLGLADDAISGNTISAASDAIVWQLKGGTGLGYRELYNAAANVFAADSDDLAGRAQLLADGTDALAQWTIDTSALPAVKFYSVSYPDRCLQRDNFPANERFAAYEQAHVAPRLYRDDSTVQTVTFDANGGRLLVDEFPAQYQYEVGKPYGVLGKAKLDDHARTGWFTEATGGDQVTEETIVDSAEPLTLYAQWTTDQVVTFDATGGECDELTRTVTVGQKYGKLPTPKWTAHVFLGWFTEEEGGKQLTRSSKVTTKPTRTMYAQWTDEQTVTFDAAGGSCDEPTRTVQIGGKYGKLPTPTWAGHVFLGWFSAPENGKQLTRSSKVTEKAERTMYAYWTDQQTVTFNANGGECDPVTKVYTIGGKYKTLPTPTLDGQVFLGWYTDAVNGRKLGPGSIVILKAERTMYAYWGDERDALSVGMSITSFSMKNAGITAARDSRGSAAPVLTFEAVAGRTYELQWAQTLDGEWTVLKSWTAAENGETSVAVPADSAVGFFRLSTSSAVK